MIVREDGLPKSNVHYTELHGTFLGFSDTETSDVYFCNCCKSSIENYLKLKEQIEQPTNSNPLRATVFDVLHFPEAIAVLDLNNVEQLLFGDELCHRCLQRTPKNSFCAPMYGGRFKQSYGWYIEQNFLRAGIDPSNPSNYLESVCPQEIRQLLIKQSKMQIQRNTLAEKLFPDATDVQLGSFNKDEWEVQRQLEKEITRLRRKVTKVIENLTREEFGFKKIGEQWVSETLLYQLVTELYPSQQVIRNIRPDWLENLELDIYLPELKLAFEYQGQQHYKPVKAWGGDKAFKALKQRDARKKELCQQLGIRLVEFKFSEYLSLANLQKKVVG